jgi:hypothetical protein
MASIGGDLQRHNDIAMALIMEARAKAAEQQFSTWIGFEDDMADTVCDKLIGLMDAPEN